MEISIIIPVYNKEEYIANCLQNILSQDFYSYEIIVVDDGSNDNSGEICDKLASKQPHIKVFHTENQGVTAARLFGYNHSNGKYIMFVDSDDILLPNALSLTYNAIKLTNADEVIAQYRTQKGNSSNLQLQGWIDSSFLIKELLSCRFNFCIIWGILFKKEILENCLNTPRQINSGEDILMQIQVLAKSPKVFFIPEYIYMYMEGLPNDRRLVLETEILYDNILEQVVTDKDLKTYLLIHKIKMYENFLNLRMFYTFDIYYKKFRRDANFNLPIKDWIVLLLPPKFAYYPVHYYKKFSSIRLTNHKTVK